MERLTSEKYAAPQHKSNLRNIRGTFAAEGMTISKSTRSNLERIAIGQRAENPSATFGDSSPFRGASGAPAPSLP